MRPSLFAGLLVVAACSHDPGPDPKPDAGADPALCPMAPYSVCGVYDGGWNVWCEPTSGTVWADDLTAVWYCAPEATEPTCTTGGPGDPVTRATCAQGCGDLAVHYFDTLDEYGAFDVTSLCAP